MNTIPKKPDRDKPFVLSAEQQQAVTAPSPLLIHAGAGSGKTRVLIERVAYLVQQGVDPFAILLVTFSVRAAQELRDRLDDLLTTEQARLITICTLHALGLRMLRDHGDLLGYLRGDQHAKITVCSQSQSRVLLKQAMQSQTMPVMAHFNLDEIAQLISAEKSAGNTPEDFANRNNDPTHSALAQIYAAYQTALKAYGLVDFDDLIAQPLALLHTSAEACAFYTARWSHVLADEAQDISAAQYALLHTLAAEHNNLTLAGDEMQSIYAFRGALGGAVFEQFQRDFPTAQAIHLPHNFRSSANIVGIADALLGRLRGPQATTQQAGWPVFLLPAHSEHQEAEQIAREIHTAVQTGAARFDECAILCRTWAQVDLAEKALLRLNVPCVVVGRGHFFDRPEVQFLLACLRLSQDFAGDSTALHQLVDGLHLLSTSVKLALQGDAPELLVEHLFDTDRIRLLAQEEQLSVITLQSILLQLDGLKDALTAQVLDFVLRDDGMAYRHSRATAQEGALTLNPIDEVLRMARGFARTQDFLNEIDVLSGQDPLALIGHERVHLLTLHAAKGLEFKLVFFIGVEEGLVPHHNATSERSLREELRLAYVGFTRATQVMCLSFARTREGRARYASPWLRGLPLEMRQRPNWQAIAITAGTNPIASGGAA